MSTKHIATSTLWQLGSQVTMAALSIVTMKFVTIGLSKELVGNYNSAYGFLQIFGILADFGLYAVAVREVSRAKDKGAMLGTVIVLRSLILLCALSVALIIAWTSPQWKGTILPVGVTIAALVPFFTLLAGTLRAIFQVTYRMHYVFVAEVTQRILTTALIVGTVVMLNLDTSADPKYYEWFLFAGGIGAFVLFAFSLMFGLRLLPFRLTIDRKEVATLFMLAAPYGIAFLCTALYRQTDITMIALLRPDYELQNAYYGVVQRMADMAYLIPTFLLNSVLPILSERDSTGEDTKHLLGKTFFIILLLGSISFLFAFLWARPLTNLLTTTDYLSTYEHPGSDTALMLIALPMFCTGIITFCFYILLNRHAWKQLVLTLLGAVAFSIGLNLRLIPSLGFVGAGLTSVCVHLFIAALLLPQALRVMPMRFSMKQLGQWLIFSIALAGFLYLLKPFMEGALSTAIGLIAATVWMAMLIAMLGLHRNKEMS